MSRLVTLSQVLRHRKGSIIIDDSVQYKRCRVQLHRRGVEVRDIVPGTVIRTKKQQLCKAGDFIVAEMDAKFGGYGFLNESLEGAIVSSHYYLFEVITEKMLPEYLAVINKTDILQNQIKAKGSTNYSAVRPVDVLGWTIPLPSLTEQQRIIDEVEVTEKEQQLLLPEFDQQLAHLTQLRQALLREAMQGQLLPQDPTDEPAAVLLQQLQAAKPGKKGREKAGALFAEEVEAMEGPFEIPASWVWTTLGGVSDVVRGGSPRPAGDKRYYEGNIPFLKVADLTATDSMYLSTHTHTIKEAGLNRTRSVEADTLMLTNSGATLGIPKICTFPTTFNDGVAAFLNIDTSISKQYLYYFLRLKSSWFLEEASKGQGQPNLNTDIIKNVPLPLPPSAEQHRIVAKLEQLLGHCDALEQRIRESRRLAEQLLATALREALAPPAGTTLPEAAELELAEAETLASHGRHATVGKPRKVPASLGPLFD